MAKFRKMCKSRRPSYIRKNCLWQLFFKRYTQKAPRNATPGGFNLSGYSFPLFAVESFIVITTYVYTPFPVSTKISCASTGNAARIISTAHSCHAREAVPNIPTR